MRKILFILAITGLVFAGCGNKKQKEAEGTHTHEDGTVHGDDAHNHEKDATPAQESFEVKEEGEAAHEGESKSEHSGEHEHSHGEGEHEHSHN